MLLLEYVEPVFFCTIDLFMEKEYSIPPSVQIGHVHLKVSDIDKALGFYKDLLGFEITQRYGTQAVFLSAGGYHHHIGLNTWYSKDGKPAPSNAPGLFHTAILYPTRKDLAEVVRRIIDAGYPLTGASDHGVSEAIYLNAPMGMALNCIGISPKNYGHLIKKEILK